MKEIDEILQAAANHPNSRVSKLIRNVEEEPSQRNIVMLMIEVAENSKYATDFRISLKYYLDLYEHLGIGRDIVLNESGVMLINSSKIYAKRVDYVQELVEHQILTISSAEKENAFKNDEHSSTSIDAEKPKRGRKRLLKTTSDPYEVELEPKKFRKLNNEKRFSTAKQPLTKIIHQRNIEQEQHVHPAVWVHSSIVDLENEEEIDSKRNYKLFTYHVEHRYNTLVPDINFRLHFKVKDYIDEEEERMEEESANGCSEYTGRDWPPLSEEYVEKYISLENYVLEGEMMPPRKRLRIEEITRKKHSRRKSADDENNEDFENNVDMEDNNATSPLQTNALEQVQRTLDTQNLNTNNETLQNDTGLGQSLLDNSKSNDEDANKTTTEAFNSTALDSTRNPLNISSLENSAISNNENLSASTLEKSSEESTLQNDSAIGESILSLNQSENTTNTEAMAAGDLSKTDSGLENSNCDIGLSDNTEVGETEKVSQIEDGEEFNLNEIRVLMPGLDDEGVYFSDLDEQDQMKLTPNVVFVDYFASIPNKKHITIILNDDLKAMLNINDDDGTPKTYEMPEMSYSNANPPLTLNIFKIEEKLLRRRILFKLGPDMDLFLKARALKRPRNAGDVSEPRQTKNAKWYPLNSTDMTGVKMTPPRSSGDESDFYGFSDDEESQDFTGFTEQEQSSANDVNTHRLSSDSGVGVDIAQPTTPGCCNLEPILEEEGGGARIDAVDNVQVNKASKHDDENNPEQEKTTENLDISASNCNEKSNQENEVGGVPSLLTGATRGNDNNIAKVEVATEKDSHETNELAANDDDVFNETTLAHLTTNNDYEEVGLVDLDIQSNKTKIQKWHEHLQPILAKSRERHHFDVFQIGTEIIEEIQNPATNGNTFSSTVQSTTFQNVMENKDESYVSRYFLSSLLLANQSNIKITVNNKNSEYPSTWSDIQFDLLSTKRHTVAIEDNIGMVNTTSTVLLDAKNGATVKNASISTALKKHNAKRLQLDSELVKVNLNVVKPLKQIEKLPRNSDDYDSGIFSSEEFAL